MLASVRQAGVGKCSTGLDAPARRVFASRSSCSLLEMVSAAVFLDRKHGFVEVGTHPYILTKVPDDIVLVHKRRSRIAD